MIREKLKVGDRVRLYNRDEVMVVREVDPPGVEALETYAVRCGPPNGTKLEEWCYDAEMLERAP